MQWKKNNTIHNGMTLIEVVIAIGIFAMVTIALYLVINLSVQVLRDDQSRLDALSIAQSEIESIKNVPYDDIGTTTGIPNGVFAATKTVEQNNTSYTVETDIRYYDDPFDGVAPTDTVNTDYKKVRVEVTWDGQFLDKPVVLLTNIVPNGIETTSGGGTLWVEVYNAATSPIANATVKVENTTVNPAISLTSLTDSQGRFLLPGAPASVQSYQITISKNGYSSEYTYTVDTDTNPNPDPGHQTVLEAEVTTKTFYIDKVSQLHIQIKDVTTGTPQANIPVHIYGNKRIGTDLSGQPIPKYSATLLSDSSGNITLTNMEYDTYTIELQDPTLDFAGSTPSHLPYVLAPDTIGTITLETAPQASQTLLLSVIDPTQQPVENASVHIVNTLSTIDLTQTTNASGQTFFSPLSAGNFSIEITTPGFTTYTGTIEILADQQQEIALTPTTP